MYFKVIKDGTNRTLVYDFLLVVYSNFCRTSWRQFRRVVGVNTPVGVTRIVNWPPTAVLCVRIRRLSSRIHVHTADADATRQNSFVLSASAVCIERNLM